MLIHLDESWNTDKSSMSAPSYVLPTPVEPGTQDLYSLTKRFVEEEKVGNVNPDTINEYYDSLGLFVDIHNLYEKTKTTDLSKESIKAYQMQIRRLPTHRNKKFPNVPLNELLHMVHDDVVSPGTIKKFNNCVRAFLEWLDDEDILETNSLIRSLNKNSLRVVPKSNRIPYTIEQAQGLLNGHRRFPEFVWPIRIAAFSGVRRQEVLSLHKEDIRQENGIWVFDIHRRLKTGSSRGLVPIAKQLLVDYKFLDWVEKQEDGSLFGEELANTAYSKFSKAYRRYLGIWNIEKPNGKLLDFHSWRHTCRSMLARAGVQIHIADMITRHSSPGISVGERVYNHHNYLQQMKDAVDTIDYGLDVKKIETMNWLLSNQPVIKRLNSQY